MKSPIDFHPFRSDGSWYMNYWFEDTPVQSTLSAKCLLGAAAVFPRARQHADVKCVRPPDTDYGHELHQNIEARG
jgi:hypothetical protein